MNILDAMWQVPDFGEAVITSAISQAFTARSALRPFDALSSWITSLLEMLDIH